jgi:hypothetical protein
VLKCYCTRKKVRPLYILTRLTVYCILVHGRALPYLGIKLKGKQKNVTRSLSISAPPSLLYKLEGAEHAAEG